MKIQLLFFGITRDLLDTNEFIFTLSKNDTVGNLKNALRLKHPQLENIDSYAIAVNESYANDEFLLQEKDIVAIIPPVSGG